MLIIGIDPGISGSICFLEDGIIKDVLEMPTMTEGKKNKKNRQKKYKSCYRTCYSNARPRCH